MTAALGRSFSSLSVPNYRRYFAGQVVSLSGNWMQTVAEVWLILKLTGNGTLVGIAAGLQFLPVLVAGAWGGLLADRIPKRRLLTITQALMALPALTLWALTAEGRRRRPRWCSRSIFLRGCVTAFDNPARQSFVVEMVGADRVVNAVSLNSVIVHTARIVGPAAAGARDRAARRRAVLPLQRADVRRDARRAAPDGSGRARHRAGHRARARPAALGAALRAARRRRCGSRWR